MGSLQRTKSFLDLGPELSLPSSTILILYNCMLQCYKEKQECQKAWVRKRHYSRCLPKNPPEITNPSCKTSPLAHMRAFCPPHSIFPDSKPKQDLHRKAIRRCMWASPEGWAILGMGLPQWIFVVEWTYLGGELGGESSRRIWVMDYCSWINWFACCNICVICRYGHLYLTSLRVNLNHYRFKCTLVLGVK